MSWLAPLYALGALAVALPILFHLIRRSPSGTVPFSSLMFLAPSPPKLAKRSRLDNLLLLLLRAAALLLLAAAFARPFLRREATIDLGQAAGSRVVVLVDTSASLRRAGLWPRAKALAERAIADCRPTDELAVFAFDATARPLLGFAESRQLPPAQRNAAALARLEQAEPTWAATHLDRALVDAVAALEDAADPAADAPRLPGRVVVVSDLQDGIRLAGLGEFEWPRDVSVELRPVAGSGSNASPHWLADPTEGPSAADADLRVRVVNEPGAAAETFELAWLDANGAPAGDPVPVYVPPGESRVVRVPRPESSATLRLTGDADPFDNDLYLAADPVDEATVLFVGPDAADDPAGLLYYLERVFDGATRRPARVVAARPEDGTPPAWDPDRPPSLVVLAGEAHADLAGRLRAYLEGGGTVLAVVAEPGPVATLAVLAGVPPFEVAAAPAGGDAMLGAIAFDHPLFAPLAGPEYGDFTKVRFWNRRVVDPAALGDPAVPARFEDGSPAVLEKGVGRGRLVVLASGWAPADSQLARSSKFVPLMATLLEGRRAGGPGFAGLIVGAALPLPADLDPAGLSIRTPDGTVARPEPGATSFDGTGRPGLYSLATPDGPRSFAVNLDPAEGRTSPLPAESLEQFGIRLAGRDERPRTAAEAEAEAENARQLRNAELEGRQQFWRGLVLAALGVLVLETLIAGRRGRARPTPEEAGTP